MTLVSIISTWADTTCILPHCINNHLQFSDAVIVVGSIRSNHGQASGAYADFISKYPNDSRVIFELFEPEPKLKPLANETRKRNHGLLVAKSKGFDLFLIADADEMYEPDKMNGLKENFPYVNGYVHPVRAYITPTLYCDDHTLVCGIHRLHKDVYCGNYPYYPFAYDSKGNAHIDPSRRLPFKSGIQMSDILCHHYTLIRGNIDMKINNSTAESLKKNRNTIHDELKHAKAGRMSKLYHKPMKESPNYFDICI
jgi:hypothetical protein